MCKSLFLAASSLALVLFSIYYLISPMMLPAALAQEGDDLATPTPIPPLPVQKETATPTQVEAPEATATPTPPALPWHGYILIEFQPATFARALDADLITKIRDALGMIAPKRGDWPPYVLQVGPVRRDGQAVIIEARWEQYPTQELLESLLGARLEMDLGQNQISSRRFPDGCVLCTWDRSHQAVLSYLRANSAAWYEDIQ